MLRALVALSKQKGIYGAGRGSRTPKTRRSADFESAASASSAIPALHGSALFYSLLCTMFLWSFKTTHVQLCKKV
jgi:hypothetical protein